jgi:hypothetical protein
VSIIIAYCHPGMVHERFMWSVNQFTTHDFSPRGKQMLKGIMSIQDLYIAKSRNQACKQFLDDTTCKWLLFLDTDIVFKPQDVYDLLAAAGDDKQIIGGLYFGYCEGDLLPVWRKKYADRTGKPYGTLPRITFGTLEEYDAIGMGFTLIRRDCLETMREEYGKDPWTWFGHDLYGASHLGEDITFCERAAKLGIKTWGHSGIVLGHQKTRTENAKTFTTEWAKLEENPTNAKET